MKNIHNLPIPIPQQSGEFPFTDDAGNKIGFIHIVNGQLHRDNDLPAYELFGEQSWFKNGSYHREGGKPARIIDNHMYEKHEEFWENGIHKMTKKFGQLVLLRKDDGTYEQFDYYK